MNINTTTKLQGVNTTSVDYIYIIININKYII